MDNRTSFSCFVIGQDTLLIECAEILLSRGHDVRGVISRAPRIVGWARKRGVPLIDPRADYVAELRREPFDYLFSITHLSIIPEEAVALAKKGAINFHDGPLPRYAGLNAPAWALLQRETTYGITWHLMASALDTGSILKQVTFDVARDETSLSLNTKCFAHAIETFGELVRELAAGTVVKTAQDLSQRSYFGRQKRPDAACVLDFRRPAEELSALVRALDFGERYANPLGAAKACVKGDVLVVSRAEEHASSEKAPPGSVVSIDDDAISVATGQGVLAIQALLTVRGEPVSPRELARRWGLQVGSSFEQASDEERDALTALDREAGKTEPFWVAKLSEAAPFEAPYASASRKPDAQHRSVSLTLPDGAADANGVVTAAFVLYCARLSGKSEGAVGLLNGQKLRELGALRRWAADTLPLSVEIDFGQTFAEHRASIEREISGMAEQGTYLRDVAVRYPELRERPGVAEGSAWPACVVLDSEERPKCQLAVILSSNAPPQLSYDASVISEQDALSIASQLSTLVSQALAHPAQSIGKLSLLSEEERAEVLVEWNRTSRDYREACLHHLIEEQAARTPDAVALVCDDEPMTYRALNERANQLAWHLRSVGVGPDTLVGVYLDRSLDLVVAALGILKAGGAYVPLDPDYPAERIGFMLDDASLRIVVTRQGDVLGLLARGVATVVSVDEAATFASYPKTDPENGAAPNNLAYVIYTSGSTGKPKGVMVEHRNVVSFFAGMDERIPHDPPGTFLAVTSLSFDISVLELFWTLARGFKVVIHRRHERDVRVPSRPSLSRPVDFSLFYFASDEGEPGGDKYDLLLRGAKFADEHGFVAVWTPERHFHAFGGLYPNPAVVGAALAVITERVQIRAGSVVLPLHHPVRVAESWSVVDNLSRGRVGISFASGWQPNDFLLRPEAYRNAKEVLFRDLEIVKALWRGEERTFPGVGGAPVTVRTLPRPVQKELPVWITTAGNIETYKMAGRIGANLLTHLLGQSLAELAPKIAAYRAARAEAGHDPETGVVSLMLHAFLGEDETAVRETVREPLKRYLGSSLELLKQYAWAFPAFSRPKDIEGDRGDDLSHLSAEERDELLEHAFARYYETSGLFGRPEHALRRVEEVVAAGVDEIACLIDFGVPAPIVLDHLHDLHRLRSLCRKKEAEGGLDPTIGGQIRRHQVTHFQCTPSMATMLLEEPAAKAALARLQCWMIGGEALGIDLLRRIRHATEARLIDMYGPTETCVWSTTHELGNEAGPIPIGRPIANTRVYVLDSRGEPLPPGVAGELFIAGHGVARGYLGRDELTGERFVADPFARMGRMYRTGDLARFRGDGVLEYLGRRDQQVKIRGHRVELEEIEAIAAESADVVQCVAIVREDVPGDQRLIAYLTGKAGLDVSCLRDAMRARLPEFMVPAHFVVLAELPYTPNGKIDRKALPPPESAEASQSEPPSPPANDTERAIAKLWEEVLGRESIGADDNFFDVGGHSLLVVRLHRRLRESAFAVTLTDLYRFPTIRSLTRYLADSGTGSSANKGAERASIRREMIERRRSRQAE